ncbi:hypothetical protein [Bacillus atrophaeus]|nr:hypothetical protein [Bacillus atrophaeus]MEC1900395.1 hypothetical protein [Bacillus atrophaeus]MEC2397939.1 hypothetical protein [Bacillus atrophaeus]MED4434220.1 hypothetical protein [Bacillus atrophaeus]MED4575823.1 hypothetical protein [Bacillus atrophaeus]MED4778361.1 hypothetical protein [Bacillus atrophaeus]
MFAVLMVFIIIEENGLKAAVSISLAKSRAAIMAAKNALFTSWSTVP